MVAGSNTGLQAELQGTGISGTSQACAGGIVHASLPGKMADCMYGHNDGGSAGSLQRSDFRENLTFFLSLLSVEYVTAF